jgi:predicted nucleic acid-binding Zn ribbon protein
MAKRDLAIDLFRSFKTGITKKRKVVEVRNNIATDPQLLGDVLTNLIEERDWKSGVAEGTLFTQWATIVGADIAQHASPVSINESVLTIQTTSTAWATQLTIVQSEILKTIQNNPFGATIESVAIIGPNTPSWKRGIRSTRDARGPRDTYN